MKLDPDNYDAHYDLGLAYFQLHEEDKAMAELRKAASSSPGRQEPWFLMAMVHYKKKSLGEAIEAYKKAIEAAPDNAYSHYGLATVYLETGRYGEAVDEFKRTLRFIPHDKGAKFRLNYISKLSRKPGDEIKAAREAVANDPGNAAAHHWLGVVLILMNIPEGCRRRA